MGNSESKSKSKSTSTTNIVNKSDIDILNKNINSFVSNTVVDQAAACSAGISMLQNIDMSNMNIVGDLNIDGIDQNQDAAITFDCVQVSEFQNDIANGVMSEYTNALETGFNTSSKDEMAVQAEGSAELGSVAVGGSSSSSKTKTNYEFNQENILNKNVRNVIENSIENNMSLSDVQECISTMQLSQTINYSGSNVGGDANFGAISQNQSATMMAKCIQEKKTANEITSEIASQLGLVVEDTAELSKASSSSSESVSSASSTGIGDTIGGIVSSITDMVSGLGFMTMAAYMSPASMFCSFIFACMAMCAMLMFGMSKKGSSSEPVVIAAPTEAPPV
jgi:hypothetical protein